MWRPARILEWFGSRFPPDIGGRTAGPGRLGKNSAGELVYAEPAVEVAEGDTRWVVHGRRLLYDSEWVRLELADVELPDGQRFEHHVVRMPAAAVTALLDDAQTHILLLWRHRFVPDLFNWELPGGLVEEGEDPAETAARETEEETGYRARRLEHLVTFEPMIGMLGCPHHIFLGRGAERIGDPAEKTEMQRMEWISLTAVPRLVESGAIRNAGTLVALLHILALSGPHSSRPRPGHF